MAAPVMVPMPDRDSAPYWSALAEGRFEVQHCQDCGTWTWPARPICSGCHGEHLAWEAPKGTGSVVSWVVTHQVYGPDWAPLVPYVIANVRLDEQHDLVIPARVVGDVEMRQGLRVRATTEKLTDDVGILLWEPMA